MSQNIQAGFLRNTRTRARGSQCLGALRKAISVILPGIVLGSAAGGCIVAGLVLRSAVGGAP